MKVLARRWLYPAVALGGLLAGCKRTVTSGSVPSASATPSAPPSAPATAQPPGSAPVVASGEAAQAPPASPPSPASIAWEPAEPIKECALHGRETDINLAFGSLTIASNGKDLATTRLLRSPGAKGEGQVAFGGYDNQVHSISTSYGLGKGAFRPTWVFPRKEDWVVFWFDARGVLYSRAGWSPAATSAVRMPAFPVEEAERIDVASTGLDAPLLGVSPLGSEATAQLGLFLFVPGEKVAEVVKAVGATHHAHRPRFPDVSASPEGYAVTWVDEPEAGKPTIVAVTRFDHNGKEVGPQLQLSTAGRAARQPALLAGEPGTLVAWVEQEGPTPNDEVVVVQALDKAGRRSGPARRLDRGYGPALASTKGGSVLVFLRRTTEGQPAHAAALFLDAAGQPAARGLLLSEADKPKNNVKEPPSVAVTEDGWLGAVFTFAEGMRSQLRTLKVEGCLGPAAAP